MSIFNLSDDLKFGNHKAKKIRNQMRIAIDEISELKEQLVDL
jgi:hypothetical protein